MKLSERTVNLLKNFATINQSILFREGNVLRTISPHKNIMAQAEIKEEFPMEFPIYDLNRFLKVLNLFESPELEFRENNVLIRDANGKNSIVYVYADISAIVAAPDKDPKVPDVEVEFELTGKQLESVLTAASVIATPDVTFKGDGTFLQVVAHTEGESSSNSYTLDLGNTDKKFNVVYKPEYFKVVMDDYNIQISSKLITKFNGKSGVSYWFAAEKKHSTFG